MGKDTENLSDDYKGNPEDGVRELVIPDAQGGQRLDLALSALLPEYSRNRIQNWIRARKISVDEAWGTTKMKVSGGEAVRAVAVRLAGEDGITYASIGQATVRSVARGILGVALIQSLLAGLGFLAVGVPGAGLLALVCLLLAVVQIGPGIVLAGAVIYVFTEASTPTAIAFLLWCVFVGLLDNFLRPLLLGRGVRVPMLVIFIGAIGGVLSSGIIGLFVGSVVLAVSYSVFTAWLGRTKPPAGPA